MNGNEGLLQGVNSETMAGKLALALQDNVNAHAALDKIGAPRELAGKGLNLSERILWVYELLQGVMSEPDAKGSSIPSSKPNGNGGGGDLIDLDMIRVREAAKLLHCHPSSIYRMIEAGDLRRFRFGKMILVKRSDLARFVELHSKM